MSALALPDIERSSPITVTADSPVLNIFQPVAETAFTDAWRDPVDRIVIADQILLHCSHLDVPALTCIVDQRSIASPAERIAVLKCRCII